MDPVIRKFRLVERPKVNGIVAYAEVESRSTAGELHDVVLYQNNEGSKCSCKNAMFRGKCDHIRVVRDAYVAAQYRASQRSEPHINVSALQANLENQRVLIERYQDEIAELRSQVADLKAAGQLVIDNWSDGSLADAVNNLEGLL